MKNYNEIAEMINTPVYSQGSEFQILAKQMKDTLTTMLKQSQYQEALSIITQLLPLLPEDLELIRMRQNVLRQMCKK